ncbi:MAG: SGNH/GDSL hydrolase family protein [Acidobacteria bacterium]|nr:SGNH/GDSL hydrolase family protein [Acidobacteriota bacterium]MCA1608583.1 SGNH/GDSL hydrolase family protein [Acidobacteriota bacterium]
MNLAVWQIIYLLAGAVILPIAPFLYLQGQYTRRKIGLIAGPEGETTGSTGKGDLPASLFVLGESTVAGLGAATHEKALAGQFAKQLSQRIGKPVRWTVIGRNGVTAKRTIEDLLPQMPNEKFDFIFIGLGGNDVLKLSSPRKWRRDMTRLIGMLRSNNPDAVIFLSNCPMIRCSPVIPQPIKFILWELSKLHDANIKELTSRMNRVYYYHQPRELKVENFFADGIHPSEQGYADWSEAMMKFFDDYYKWRNV